MSKHTRVPEISEEFESQVRAQPEIEDSALIIGGRVTNDYHDYIVFLGYRPGTDEWITSARAAPGGQRPNDSETITYGVLVAVTDRDDNMVAARRRAGEKLRAIERVVTENMTLGMSGVNATMGNAAWLPLHTDKGAECNVSVDVIIKALL
jgi:hypothetical protein